MQSFGGDRGPSSGAYARASTSSSSLYDAVDQAQQAASSGHELELDDSSRRATKKQRRGATNGSSSTNAATTAETPSPPIPGDRQGQGSGSNTGASAGAGGDGDAKPHVCEWPGCGKAFSRPDHLNRHRLNHRPSTIYKCSKPGCPKTFVRNDLLVRHEERHERKGEEGATGALSRNSVTSARKLQSSGAIPSELPYGSRARAPSGSTSSPSVDGASPVAGSHLSNAALSSNASTFDGLPHLAGLAANGSGDPHGADFTSDQQRAMQDRIYNLPPAYPSSGPPTAGPSSAPFNPYGTSSPNAMPPPPINPYSMSGPSNGVYASPSSPSVANLLNPYRADGPPNAGDNNPGGFPGANGPGQTAAFFDSLNDPPGPQSSMPGFEEPLNFIQQSYGVPFVSASEYSWLFDPSGGFDIQFANSRPVSPGPDIFGLNGPGGSIVAGAQAASNGAGRTPGSGMSPEDLEEVARGLDLHAQAQNGGFGRIGTEWDAIGTPSSPGKRPAAEMTPQSAVDEARPTPPPAVEPSPRPAPSPRAITSDSESVTFNAPNPPTGGIVDRSTYIDERTRLRIIEYLEAEGKALRNDPRLSRVAMMQYMEDFWLRIHETQTPGIHRASFKTSRAKTPLLLSMLLLGCYFGPLESHQLAVKLHSFFRGKVICSMDFKPRAELWLHQTILLIIIFGKLCSTRLHHEMAHIFWSSCVTLGRRSAIFSQRNPAVLPKGKENDIEARWAAWIEEESAKRTALIIFALDVEHASLFRHSPALSAFQIQVQLPCDEEEWEATTAQEWCALHARSRPPVPFISALKASLMAGHSPPVLNPFSRIAILHGLLSVAQDLQWRDHVIGLSQPERAHNWRDMISSSYNSWKSRLDTCLAGVTAPTTQLLRASISLYAVAHITLSIDIHELQIYAGAESALGLLVSTAVFHATEARIRMWSSTKDARAACWHAAFFLRDSMQHYEHAKEDLAGCLHHRWCVFIATLTLYCYGRATSGRPGPRTADYKASALRFLDSLCCDSPEGLLLVQGKNNSLDLCQMIQEYIETSRWEIAQEGAKILRRLLTNPCPGPPKGAA